MVLDFDELILWSNFLVFIIVWKKNSLISAVHRISEMYLSQMKSYLEIITGYLY